jgi:hypothetical protein
VRYTFSLFLCLFVLACPNSGTEVVDESPSESVGPCNLDTDCGLWEKCVQGICATDLCAGGACEGNECTDRNDCELGLVCIDSECVPPPETCTSSEDCPAGTFCDAFTGECVDPDAPDVNDDGGNVDGSADGTGSDQTDGGSGSGYDAGGSGTGSTTGSSDGSTTGNTSDVTATETCLGAPSLTGNSGNVQGHYGLLNDYVTDYNLTNNWSSGCTGSSTASGREVVYAIDVPNNKTLTVTVNAECASCDQSQVKIDEVIYLLNTCPADGTSFDGDLDNCVAGAQDNYGGPDNPTETFSHTNSGTSSQTYYVVVDAWCADLDWFYCPTSADGFTLEWTIQ